MLRCSWRWWAVVAVGACSFACAAGSPPTEVLTKLEAGRHGPAYLRRLSYGLAHFRAWLLHSGCPLTFSRHHRKAIDDALATYIQSCFENGVSFAVAKHAVLAVQKQLHLRFKLHRAWTALKAWFVHVAPRHRVPLPMELLKLLFAAGVDAHFRRSLSPLVLILAVLLRVGFFGLLRPGEIFKLQKKDVRIGQTSARSPVATLILRSPKNKASMGANQFVIIHDPGSVLWLGWLLDGLDPEVFLWPSTGLKFRGLLGELLEVAGLGHLRLSPGCLRPGGATWLFTENIDIQRLQFMGRWKSLSSLTSYIQEAMACLVWLELSSRMQAHISAAISCTSRVWDSPPVAPRSSLFDAPRGWRLPSRRLLAPHVLARSS
jgi:hypothetical protein